MGDFSLHRGHPLNVPIRRTMHLSSDISANDTRESVFGLQNVPLREWGSNLVPLAPEASALTTSYHAFSREKRCMQNYPACKELIYLTLSCPCILETPKWLLWQTAKTQVKCSSVCTICRNEILRYLADLRLLSFKL